MQRAQRWRDRSMKWSGDLHGVALSRLGAALRRLTGSATSADAPLTFAERAALEAILDRMAPGDGPDLPSARAVGALAAVVQQLRCLPPEGQQQLRDLLLVFECFGVCAAGGVGRFSRSAAALQDATLSAWGGAKLSALRAGFHGLKTVCMLGYWSRSQTWDAIGYDGPRAHAS
jgi:hypothetical protein